MEQLDTIFEYLPTYRIAICKTHRQGIVQSQLRGHIDSKHRELTVKTRQEIVSAAALYHGWARTEDEVVFPEGETTPVPHLTVHQHAFMCTAPTVSNQACGHINQQLKHIQHHCREKHGWQNPQKRGRQSRGALPEHQRMWLEGVACQKFQAAGRLGQLFAVTQPQASTRTPDREDEDIQRAITASLSQARVNAEARAKEQQDHIQADQDRYTFHAWLDRAGWAKHLKGFDRSWLSTTIRKPDPTEKALDRVCWALRMVIYKAQQSSRPEVVGMAAMNYINRREMGGTTNEKPFHARQTEGTMIKYSGWWLEIVRYIWRTHALPEISAKEREEEGGGVQGRRPPYRLTAPQAALLQDMEATAGRDADESEEDWFEETDSEDEWDEGQEEELEEMVLTFALRLLDHPLGDHEYSSAIISAMAVMGIDANSGWISPLLYTPKQAAVINVSRMLVLYGAAQMRKAEIAQLEAGGLGRSEAEERAHSHFDCVKELANRFMTLTSYGGQPTPMDAILRLKAYGMKIRFNTSGEGVIDWVDDTLLYGHLRFSMPQLRSMIHGAVASARQHLMKELLLLQIDDEGEIVPDTTALPAIHWDRLVDNPAEQKMGWSFMEDVRNREATDVPKPPLWLEQRIIDEKPLRRAFIDATATREAIAAGRPAVWSADRVKQYRRAMQAFRRALVVLVHTTYGLPARASELLTIQYKNSANGESRGVFIEDGLVGTVTRYHKNIGSTGKPKVIYRYLPREVGELVVYYLWFALPFWEKMEGIVGGKAMESSAYIWQPEPEKEWKMPQRKRRVTGEDSEEEGPGPEEDGGEESAMEPWNANRVKHAMQKTSLAYMGVKLNIMAWRHGSKAIYRRYIGDKAAVRTYMQADEEDSSGEEEDEAADLQTGHSSHVGGLMYGRHITEAVFSTESKRAAFRRVSREWHAFLHMSCAIGTRSRRLRTRAARREAIEEEYRRWKMMRHVDVEGELKKMVGEQAAFRSVQKPALQAIMRQESPVVAIMGTGAGKSILFMLPASVSTGVTVVVVPLVSLRGNMRERCHRLGITCVEWSSRRPNEWAQVVLVTPESAVGEAFGQFINRQRAMGRLDRIVVDECHVVMDSLQGWRGRMLALRGLMTVETQVVYLTATLRPSEEAQFLQLMGLPGKERCQWFRGETTRPNIRYRVHDYDVQREEEEVEALVGGLKRRYPGGQVIVYCSSVAKTVRLAEVLQCVCYHRNVGSQGEKEKLVEQLTSGSQPVFTATNALGLGVDAPTIRAVVHVGAVRKVRHYAQESGRAGRDGSASEAIIMRGFRVGRKGATAVPFPQDGEPEMAELIGGGGCIREVLDKAMDGREDRRGCGRGEERCQRCEMSGEGTHTDDEMTDSEGLYAEDRTESAGGCEEHEFEQQMTGRRAQADRVNRQEAQDAMEVGQLEELMEEWRKGCQRCRAWGAGGDGHEIWGCREEMAEEIRQGIRGFEERKRWARFSCCFECGLPQSVCESFRMDVGDGGYRKQEGNRCQYGGVLVETVFSVWARQVDRVGGMLQAAMEEDGWRAQTEEERELGPGMGAIGSWFCEKKRWGGIEGNKMSWFLVQAIQQQSLGSVYRQREEK